MQDSVFDLAEKYDIKVDLHRKSSILKSDTFQRHFPRYYPKDHVETSNKKKDKLWQLIGSYLPTTVEAIQERILNHVEYTIAKTRYDFTTEDCYRATAFSIRERLIEQLNDTLEYFANQDVKQCYYLSLEYLLGRVMQNALVNLQLEEHYKEALDKIGYELKELYECEHDPALGNGGLGRLAACYLDSMATLNYPCWGYGLRYTYGIFEQKIIDGQQIEYPDYWLILENPWEICRWNTIYCVRFHGHVERSVDSKNGHVHYRWYGGTTVEALAYDNPIPGYKTRNCINLRLWKATPAREFDFQSFNSGNYMEAVHERQDAESITAVLYPNDNTEKGRILRLKQQYFFACATIQDILHRFKRKTSRSWDELPDKVVIQLNDTHPAVGITELMRLLVDIEQIPWDQAWTITKSVFRYTNHTVLPEACEKWSQGLFECVLPRHLQILNEINFQFLTQVRSTLGHDSPAIPHLSIYEEGPTKMIRMTHLAIIGSLYVNGVAPLHSRILKDELFKDFSFYFDKLGETNKFQNVTNGVTLRRWIHACNPSLSTLITETLHTSDWLSQSTLLSGLEKFADDTAFVEKWMAVKYERKQALADFVWDMCHVRIDPHKMMFDVHVKRIHEYKRQLLNVLYLVHRYLTLKSLSQAQRRQKFIPRAYFFAGKAAPGYYTAKLIIKLIHTVASWINNDKDVEDYLKVVFIPNYNVSSAMVIIPGADIGHHISTAGTEASGTSCIKLVLNGGLIIGTDDGANIEIKNQCGQETFFSFGLKVDEIHQAREEIKKGIHPIDPHLTRVFDFIRHQVLMNPEDPSTMAFIEFFDQLTSFSHGHLGDYYLVLYDFTDFCRVQNEIDQAYRHPTSWYRSCIKACSRMGSFSSDCSVNNYAQHIWNLEPCPLPPLNQPTN